MKKYLNQLAFKALYLTRNLRPLPDFIIIGAQKSGTSSLFYLLSQHERIKASHKKEIHFFDGGIIPGEDNFQKGEDWYRAHFPITNKSKNILTGEASPLYMFHPLSAKRMHMLLPNVKIIAILRNPVERAISHYFHTLRGGFEPLSLMEALQKEEERILPYMSSNNFNNHLAGAYAYKQRGLYKQQLEKYYNIFPENQILILSTEELQLNPSKTLTDTFKFLNIESTVDNFNLTPQNVGSNKNEVDEKVVQYLTEYFEPHNKDLFKLIGKEFSW